MSSRKEFLSKIGGGAAALTLATFFNPQTTRHILDELGTFSGSAEELAVNESFWYRVQPGLHRRSKLNKLEQWWRKSVS